MKILLFILYFEYILFMLDFWCMKYGLFGEYWLISL